MSRTRTLLLAAICLTSLPVAAQQVSPYGSQPESPPTQAPHQSLDRFNAANISHDGRLTLQQAQAAHMRWVSQHFADIDTTRKGYITIADIRAYRRHIRAGQVDASASQPAARQAHRFLDRFNAANITHDGRLTLEQAQVAHMPWVTNHFATLDSQQKGYITIQDIRAYRQQFRPGRSEIN